jgi:hypothetical protein
VFPRADRVEVRARGDGYRCVLESSGDAGKTNR